MGSVTCVLCMTAAHCDCDWTSRKPSENRLQKRFICAVAQRNCLAQHMSKLVQTAAEATSIRHELAGQPVQHTVRKAGSVAMSMMLANSDRVAGCKTWPSHDCETRERPDSASVPLRRAAGRVAAHGRAAWRAASPAPLGPTRRRASIRRSRRRRPSGRATCSWVWRPPCMRLRTISVAPRHLRGRGPCFGADAV